MLLAGRNRLDNMFVKIISQSKVCVQQYWIKFMIYYRTDLQNKWKKGLITFFMLIKIKI